MDFRYLPFYGGLYGGALQPALYSHLNGGYPFKWHSFNNGGFTKFGGLNYPFGVNTGFGFPMGFGGMQGNGGYPFLGYGSYGLGFYGY